jgi:hypothetical protein
MLLDLPPQGIDLGPAWFWQAVWLLPHMVLAVLATIIILACIRRVAQWTMRGLYRRSKRRDHAANPIQPPRRSK